MPWNEGLREQQEGAAGTPRGDCVLLAGPGTGKTFVLVRRIEYLIETGVAPDQITVLTFSRAAAAEMRERLEQRLGGSGRRVRVATLHSYALRQLLAHGSRSLPAPLRVADDWEERWIVIEELAEMLDVDVKDIKNGRDGALDRLADDWDTLDVDGDGWEEGFPDPKFLGALLDHRVVYGYTLRAELVYQLLCELRADPAMAPTPSEVLIVDEYQDLNRCDLTTLRTLAERLSAEVFAAGDDDQSIYSFRQAAPAGIRNFDHDYPQSERLVLEECLRCGADIVDLANWLIRQEVDREPKELRSVTDWQGEVHLVRFANQAAEAAGIARLIKAEIEAGAKPQSILVLAKSDPRGWLAAAIREQLEKLDERIYLPRGSRGPREDDLQRLVAYLVLSSTLSSDKAPDDLALRTLLQIEKNGIGWARLWRVIEHALENGIRFHEAARACADGGLGGTLTPVAVAADEILETARSLAAAEGETFDEWLVRVTETLEVPEDKYVYVLELSRQVSGEVAELEMTLEGTDEEVDEPPTAEQIEPENYLPELLAVLANPADVMPASEEGAVTFTTMHGAKGLTADMVFILQAEDEIIPGEAAGPDLDEARRLLYVSLTRAKKKLIITACQQRIGAQRYVGQQVAINRHLTSFLKDYGLGGRTIAQYLEQLGE